MAYLTAVFGSETAVALPSDPTPRAIPARMARLVPAWPTQNSRGSVDVETWHALGRDRPASFGRSTTFLAIDRMDAGGGPGAGQGAILTVLTLGAAAAAR